MTASTLPALLAIAIPALLFLYLVWRREWEWIGLYVALSFGISTWIKCSAMLANFWEPSAPHRLPLGGAIIGSVLYLGGMVGAMRGPSTLRTLFVALAAMETLFVGVVPIYRFAFDLDQGAYFAINGHDVPNVIGFTITLLLAVIPMIIGIPWMLARQSASEKTIIATALSRYGQLSGIGVVAFMVFATCFVAWGYIGRGPFSGEPQRPAFEISQSLVGPNMIFGMLMGVIIYLFWSFPKRFFDPVVDLLEASQAINSGPLADIAHPLWRGLARTLDLRREEARQNMLIAEEARAQMQAFLDNAPVAMGFIDVATQKLVMINPAGAAYYGQTPEEMLGTDLASFRPHYPDFDNFLAQTATTVTNKETNLVETAFLDHKGETRTLLLTSFPVLGPSGSVALLGQVYIDVTEQRRAEAELNESRAQLIGFFDNLPTSIYLKTADHEVIYVSKHLAEQYGKHPEDMVGQHEYDLHIEEMKPHLKMMDAHIMATGEAVLMEGEHLQFHRQELVSRFPIFNDKGEITHIGGMNFDVDARAKAQAALEESRALFEAFIRNAPYPMTLMDAQGRYVMFNRATAEYYGHSPEELLATDPAIIHAHYPDHETVMVPKAFEMMKSLEMQQFNTVFRTNSDELRDFSVTLFPILGENGQLAFIGSVANDLTTERHAQAELAKSTEALHQSEKLAALGSMLAGVSHELNNPLAAVIGQTALLGEDLEGTEHAERIGKIKRAADRCARIVQSFLAMARQKAPDYRSININDQVRSAAELTEYQMRAANVAVEFRLQDALPPIDADPDELHQVLVNLLTNARQALEECSGDRTITITTARKGKTVRLSVADNGKGIDAATRERIFDPFFTTKEVGTGTGIGLSYSLGIIEAHGGTLTIEDADVGTIFVITLPVSGAKSESAAPEPANPAKTKGRALVIDDEEDVADTLADMLKRMGIEATVAIGGLAGQEIMDSGAAFDLVLSDIRMPDVDGPALYDWVQANRPDLAGVLAYVTGDTMSGTAADFIARVQCPVLEKPFTPAGLRELVAAVIKP